jgi:hypothetical protein
MSTPLPLPPPSRALSASPSDAEDAVITPTLRLAVTNRRALAHVIVCCGCCCGRTDRGRPEVPVDWLKGEWKARKLLKHVQLTISGCLGPCDVPNVAAVASGQGVVWLHHLTARAHFDALLAWATGTAAAGHTLPLPPILNERAFERFAV